MHMTEGILVVIVIVLTVCLFRQKRANPEAMDAGQGAQLTGSKVVILKHPPGCKCAACIMNPESNATRENAEYFADYQGSAEAKDADTSDANISYSVGGWGPNMDYKDWTATQAVDSQVIANHAEFVKDRLGDNNQNVTGRTWTPDDHTADQITWMGLRRPEAVPISGYSTQIPDMNMDWFNVKPVFTWKSSQ